MKKLFLLLAFFGTFALTVNAQTAEVAVEETATEMTAADKAAEADAAIISEVCAHSGTVSYYKTATDRAGEVSKTKVNFDAATGTFVSAKAAGCSKKEKASCAKDAKKKACCSGKKKSSCSKKTK